ncbi:unnamed protein product [Schistosoma mattheei]|uniref:Uncharacterized protein n=1 Tax=Schistosoma mattheei TaxID=31246 RepID=A0A3P8BA74_9TREM|nr:unnamed protein product [Schistosoma mattheei]
MLLYLKYAIHSSPVLAKRLATIPRINVNTEFLLPFRTIFHNESLYTLLVVSVIVWYTNKNHSFLFYSRLMLNFETTFYKKM